MWPLGALSIPLLMSRATNITGDYSGPLRPQIHYSPPVGFMNDPNGLLLDPNGTWHLYYQYNPTELVAGNQHWGHATSPDLYHWTNQPIAIYPPEDGVGVFTGSAVLDPNNTSGFFPNQTDGIVAIYTLNYPSPANEVQAIAYSTDGGYTFTPYSGNPVIDVNDANFRDPKVIWVDNQWVMTVSFAQDFAIAFYTSPDLKTWTHASNFSTAGLLGEQYECPNLVRINVKDNNGNILTGQGYDDMYILIISINPGAPQGGSATQYFPGHFDGTTFTPVDGAARIIEWGKDDYAGQFVYGTGPGAVGDAVFIGWASNWQYTETAPTEGEGWRSAMAIPRSTYLTKLQRVGWTLVLEPYQNLDPVRNGVLSPNTSVTSSTPFHLDFSKTTSNAIFADIGVCNVAIANLTTSSTLNFTLSNSAGDSVKGGYVLNSWVWLDRTGAAYDNPLFSRQISSSYLIDTTRAAFDMTIAFDRSLLELFIDGARSSATAVVFPQSPLNTLDVVVGGLPDGTDVSVQVWELKSVWE